MASTPEVTEARRVRMAQARHVRLVKQRTAKRDAALEYIRATAAGLPPLSDDQKADLAALLRGAE